MEDLFPRARAPTEAGEGLNPFLNPNRPPALPTTTLTASVRNTRLIPLNDLYALATGALLSDVVEFYQRRGAPYDPRAVVADVTGAIGLVHTSFTIHREVLASLPSTNLVEPAPGLRSVLEQLRGTGKQLFLVTNSPLWYVQPQLDLFVGPDWRDFFEITVASARKPAWFLPDPDRKLDPLREISAEDGSLGVGPVREVGRGKCYAGGSVGGWHLEILGSTSGSTSARLTAGTFSIGGRGDATDGLGRAEGALPRRLHLRRPGGCAAWSA